MFCTENFLWENLLILNENKLIYVFYQIFFHALKTCELQKKIGKNCDQILSTFIFNCV